MTSSIITFSLSFLALHFFLIKVIFERVLILPLNKSLAVLPESFVICYIGRITVAKECLPCFSDKSDAIVTLRDICFSIYFTFEV